MKAVLIAGLSIFSAAAQSSSEPATLLRVIRSVSRPGLEAAAVQPYVNAKAAVTVFGMTALAGAPETWLIEAHDSFGSIEDLDRTLVRVVPGGAASVMAAGPDDLLTPSRTLIAIHRPEWSYRPQEALPMISKAAYFHVSIYRSTTDADFAEVTRGRRTGMERVNLDRPDIAYEVISGAPSGTYLVFAPLTSLRTLDDGMAARAIHREGGGSGAAAKAGVTREHLLFHVEPRMSYVAESQ